MNGLDFLIIGAQKSGTTTLWRLLDEHPGVYVPPGKEPAYFNGDHFDPGGSNNLLKADSRRLQREFGVRPPWLEDVP